MRFSCKWHHLFHNPGCCWSEVTSPDEDVGEENALCWGEESNRAVLTKAPPFFSLSSKPGQTVSSPAGERGLHEARCCVLGCFSWFFATLWTIACQAPLSMGFSRKEYWSGLPFPSPGIFPTQGSNTRLLYLLHRQAGSLPLAPPGKPGKTKCWQQKRYNQGFKDMLLPSRSSESLERPD